MNFCFDFRLPAVSECGVGGPPSVQASVPQANQQVQRPSSSGVAGGGGGGGGGAVAPGAAGPAAVGGAGAVASSAQPSGMAVSRVPSPPPPEVNTPVAENWCYTQVRQKFKK